MATNSTQTTVFGARFSPLVGEPRMGLVPLPNLTVTSTTATTAGGVVQLTAAELLGGFIIIDTQDAQSARWPDAADLNAAIPGVAAGVPEGITGVGFYFDIKNTGDSTLTMTTTGATGVTYSGTATLLTGTGKRFLAVVTNASQYASEAAYTVYSLGPYTP